MAKGSNHNQILDNVSTAVMLLGTDLRVQYLNAAAEQLLEFSEARAMDIAITDLLPLQGTVVEEMQAALSEHSTFTYRDFSLQTHAGQTISVDLVVSPYLGEDSTTTGLILELQPLDRIMRISRDESLVASQQTTQAMIRGLAHEIKNPLGGLRGAAQLLAMELPSAELKEYTNIIIAESDRLRELVDRMLGSNQRPTMAPVNIHEILEHIRQLLIAEVGRSVTVERDYDPSVPEILGDRAQLIQAMLNIVRNAVQATGQTEGDRRITLRTRIQRQFTIGAVRHRLTCRVDICDNGPGIDPSLVNSIFVPMVSGRSEGTGLGLAISQSIINQHKGLIECSSQPGNTVFSLYIPVEEHNASK